MCTVHCVYCVLLIGCLKECHSEWFSACHEVPVLGLGLVKDSKTVGNINRQVTVRGPVATRHSVLEQVHRSCRSSLEGVTYV
jgi:hypothetical protein